MGRLKNDGKGRLGGRGLGTPNKVSGELKEWISGFLSEKRELFEQDLMYLTPSERVRVYIGLLPYVLPKCQPVPPEVEEEAHRGIVFQVEGEEGIRRIMALSTLNPNECGRMEEDMEV